MAAKIEVLSDEAGAVEFGWVASGVFFVRCSGGLSGALGNSYASALLRAVTQVQSLHYFADITELTTYDLVARSAFFRVVLEHRRKFRAFTVLSWPSGLSRVERSLLSVFGDSVEILTARTDFEDRLFRSAPRARDWLGALQPLPPSARQG